MRKYDYSEEVVLLDEETGFGISIPRRYQNGINNSYDLTSLDEDYDWQLTYKFTSDFRPNNFGGVKYGSPNMTYRRLYELLCDLYNGGIYFVDTYFNDVFPYTLKGEFDDYLQELKNDILEDREEEIQKEVLEAVTAGSIRLKKDGTPDFRFSKTLKNIFNKPIFYTDYIRNTGFYLANRIKEDIVFCLSSGQIPLLNAVVSLETEKKREFAGLPPYPKFFASGEFINNIVIFCRLEKKEWKEQHYMAV